MADDSDFSTDATPTLQQLATFLADEIYSVDRLKRLQHVMRNAQAEGATVARGAVASAAVAAAELLGKFISLTEGLVEPIAGPSLAKIAGHLVGVDISTSELRRSAAAGGDGVIGDAMSQLAFKLLAPPDGELQPGREGAEKFVKTMSQLVFNGWFEATAFEMITTLFPDMDSFESVAELPHELVNSLGLSRLARTALRPLAHLLIATPLDWHLSKAHRPKLLGEADILKAFLRGDYTPADATEELSRLGYSDKRQDVLLKNSLKWLSADDSLVLVRHGVVDRQFAIDNLRAQGFDAEGAQNALLVADTKRQEAIQDDSVAALKSAYVDRRIDDAALSTFLAAIYVDDGERALHEVAFRTMRDMNTKRLTASQAEACVKAKVLPIVAYREALRLEGYDEEAVLSLELLLETQLAKDADVEKLRAQKVAELAAAAKVKADAAAAKQAAVEQQRALAQRGPLTELVRAAVRGLIPIARVVEVLAAQYDADTVSIYVADLEQQRAAYLLQQQEAEDAAKRATLRHIDVGALETAVLERVLTLQQFRQQLDSLNFAPADADILTATLQAKQADLDAAKKQRADAASRASRRSIDLTRFEALVRRGHRSLADYDALLASLGFDEASRAAMGELLQLEVADDQAARDARAAVAAKNPAQGLTLEQARRAVILGVQTIDEFAAWLMAHKFTVDVQAVLLAELRDDVAQADAARAKRTSTTGARVETRVPLATVARAARLGVVSPAVYQQRLVDAGYTPDDLAIEMDLLAVEIADVQAARTRAAAAEAKTTDRGLSLDQLARAVKLDESTLDDYRARAVTLGYAADDVDLLVAVLSDDVQTVHDAQTRHASVTGQLAARNLSLSELEAAVKAGQMTVDAYTAKLIALGFGADDADLLTTLLVLKLPAPASGL